MQETDDCGYSDGDFKKCVTDCASCDDNIEIDSCSQVLNVTCSEFKSRIIKLDF